MSIDAQARSLVLLIVLFAFWIAVAVCLSLGACGPINSFGNSATAYAASFTQPIAGSI